MQLTEQEERIMRAARAGYEAYSRRTGGKSAVTGEPLPEWQRLPGGVANAWYSAAQAIIAYYAKPSATAGEGGE